MMRRRVAADMTTIQELSAGVIPYRRDGDRGLSYLVLHSATGKPPSQVGVSKGGKETGRGRVRQTAGREFQEETGLSRWTFREGFEKNLSYTYIRRGRKVVKTVTYFITEVLDSSTLTRSPEHVEDPFGHWYHWGSFEQVSRLLYHAKIRQVFAEADAWLRS